MPDDYVRVIRAAVIVVAIVGFLRVGKIGDLAVETAAAGKVEVVRPLRGDVDHRGEGQGPDVRIAAVRSGFGDDCAGQLVIDELVLEQSGQMIGEMQTAAHGNISTPREVAGTIAGGAAGSDACLEGEAMQHTLLRPGVALAARACGAAFCTGRCRRGGKCGELR